MSYNFLKGFKNALAYIAIVMGVLLLLIGGQPAYSASSRIKDIVEFEGVRDNMLVGYGIVVGLNGTGDSIDGSPYTEQTMIGMLERMGVSVRDQEFDTDSVASVVVTATMPPFMMQGQRIDITVSALGDSTDLMGGTLLVTPLMGADGSVYAVAQGPIATNAFRAEGDAETVTQNVPTTARISSGAIIEKELPFKLNDMESVRLSLRNPDFTTARRIAQTINIAMNNDMAVATDPATVAVQTPEDYDGTTFDLITDLEQLPVTPDSIAKVVIDEGSGVIVMGRDVRISEVAIAQGNLTIRVTETPQVSQPGPFAQAGETRQVQRTNINVNNADGSLTVLNAGVSIQDLVSSLNALGVTPRNIITILQSIKSAGALQADIEII